jgi:hypothetical protein
MPPAYNKALFAAELEIALEELPRQLEKVGLPRVIPRWYPEGSVRCHEPEQYSERAVTGKSKSDATKKEVVLTAFLKIFESKRAAAAKRLLGGGAVVPTPYAPSTFIKKILQPLGKVLEVEDTAVLERLGQRQHAGAAQRACARVAGLLPADAEIFATTDGAGDENAVPSAAGPDAAVFSSSSASRPAGRDTSATSSPPLPLSPSGAANRPRPPSSDECPPAASTRSTQAVPKAATTLAALSLPDLVGVGAALTPEQVAALLQGFAHQQPPPVA